MVRAYGAWTCFSVNFYRPNSVETEMRVNVMSGWYLYAYVLQNSTLTLLDIQGGPEKWDPPRKYTRNGTPQKRCLLKRIIEFKDY